MSAAQVLEIPHSSLFPMANRQMSLVRKPAVVFDFAGICIEERMTRLALLLEREVHEIRIVRVPEFQFSDFLANPAAYANRIYLQLEVLEYSGMEPYMTAPVNGMFSAQMSMKLCRQFESIITIIRWVPAQNAFGLVD